MNIPAIESITLTPVTGSVQGVAANAQGDWPTRSSLTLRLHTTVGIGVGESSPLPGYSSDDLPGCQAALRTLSPVEVSTAARSAPDFAALLRLASAWPLPPAARFALDTALLGLASLVSARPPWRILCPLFDRDVATVGPVPVAALVDPFDNAAGATRHAIESGVEVIKIKIGRPGRFDDELGALRRWRQRFPIFPLRLDANRALPRADLALRLSALASLRPELLEEPTDDPLAISATPIPLALDESLQTLSTDDVQYLLGRGCFSHLVIKPMVLGGIAAAAALTAIARRHAAQVIWSHAFDGPRALAATAHLALAAGGPTAAGLAPHAALTAWPEVTPDWLSRAPIVPPMGPGLLAEPPP